jgi:hypothetical protein
VDDGVKLARARDVGAERLLEDHARVVDHVCLAEATDDVGEDLRRHRAEDELLRAPDLLLGSLDRAFHRARAAGCKPSADVLQPLGEAVPALALRLRAAELLDRRACEVAEVVVAHLTRGGRDQAPLVGQELGHLEVVEAREELAAREVSGGAEEDDRRRADARCARAREQLRRGRSRRHRSLRGM